jgi:hypothetical protein
MKRVDGSQAHATAFMDTPFGVPYARQKAAKHPDDLLDCPGVHLKSIESYPDQRPKNYGVLTSHTEDKVVVMSKEGSEHHPSVWTGAPDEYRAMWRVD